MQAKRKRAYSDLHDASKSARQALEAMEELRRVNAGIMQGLAKESTSTGSASSGAQVKMSKEQVQLVREHYEEVGRQCEVVLKTSTAVKKKIEALELYLGEPKGEKGELAVRADLFNSSGGSYIGQRLPTWVAEGASPPPLCGKVPLPLKQRLLPTDLVASKTSKPHETPSWIMCKVLRSLDEGGSYEVEDISPEDGADPKSYRYKLDRGHLVPLPKFEPKVYDEVTEYPKGHHVMALFPGTTSFYEALVVAPPSAVPGEVYHLRFEDDEDAGGQTPVRSILPQWVLDHQQ